MLGNLCYSGLGGLLGLLWARRLLGGHAGLGDTSAGTPPTAAPRFLGHDLGRLRGYSCAGESKEDK